MTKCRDALAYAGGNSWSDWKAIFASLYHKCQKRYQRDMTIPKFQRSGAGPRRALKNGGPRSLDGVEQLFTVKEAMAESDATERD